MPSTSDYAAEAYTGYHDHPARVQYLLHAIADQVPFDYACVLSAADGANTGELIAEQGQSGREDGTRWAWARLARLSPQVRRLVLDRDALAGTAFAKALKIPFLTPERVLGMLVLFSYDDAPYPDDVFERIDTPVALIHVLLENAAMYHTIAQNMLVAQSIQIIAREIATNPSPQHVVNLLRDYFFGAHITSCALLLFGPVREDQPENSFDYLEVRGTWSARRGSGVGVGVRFYLKDQPDLLALLDRDQLLVFPNAHDLTRRLDPLLRVFVLAERVRSIALIGLYVGARKLGVIFIGTDKRHVFPSSELQGYRTLSEFLAVNVMTQLLQAQHAMVMQGRAALLDAVTDGVLMVTQGADGARVLTVNQRFVEMFALGQIGMEGWLLREVVERLPFTEQVRTEVGARLVSIPVRDPSLHKGEFRMQDHDGHPNDIEWYSAPVYQRNQVLGRIYIFHDITPERTAQRLRAAFLSRVSHELRTPLTAIRGFAEFILEATGSELPDLAREYTEIILNSAKHLNRVFDDMIQITRADAGELKLNRDYHHLPDIAIDVAARLELMIKGRGQKVVLDLDDDLPPVYVDRERIAQIITNLLTNANKYSPEGGTIRVTTHFLARTDELPGSAPKDILLPAILVSVTDEGEGLTREDAEKVFMPYYRTKEANASRMEGVGLGLAVTRSLVEIHRGRIWAEPRTTSRKGGQFLFTIPTVEEHDNPVV